MRCKNIRFRFRNGLEQELSNALYRIGTASESEVYLVSWSDTVTLQSLERLEEFVVNAKESTITVLVSGRDEGEAMEEICTLIGQFEAECDNKTESRQRPGG
jgi:phosphotransferase system HPr-like phosphotransfer protein